MIVETKKILIDSKLECASGEALEGFELMTDFYGQLNDKKDNAILAFHALTGDQFASGVNPITNKEGWWNYLIGPGKAIDTRTVSYTHLTLPTICSV